MPNNLSEFSGSVIWRKKELFLFRFAFAFLLLLSLPLYGTYYNRLFSISLFDLRFEDLLLLTYHTPGVGHFATWGFASFYGWWIALALALAISLIWSYKDKNTQNYNILYYWGRVFLRYRLALGVIVYGIILLIPVQIPSPALSDLHTAYGDFLPWKIYFHSTGVAAAGYRQTIGAFEILGAILLLNRRTVAIGAIIIAFILVNVVLANFAYNIGAHLYSSYLLLLSIVLLAHDAPRLYNLLSKETIAYADKFRPVLSRNIRRFQVAARTGFAIFSVVFLVISYRSYSHHWPYPDNAGLKDAAGFYNVSTFRINDQNIPYSLSDSVRWKDVVFENWNVLSVRKNYSNDIEFSSPEIPYGVVFSWKYEALGNAGRRFYSYTSSGDTLHLKSLTDTVDSIDFLIKRPDADNIILQGKTNAGDSIAVALNKINKEYLLLKGRRKPLSIY